MAKPHTPLDAQALKRRVAAAALERVQGIETLGVGTGSTVNAFIDVLAAHPGRIASAVSSSEASSARLRAAGIAVRDLNEVEELPLYIDGADEANAARHLIKGGGGALTREKIIAAVARTFVCIIDAGKLVATLGAFPLPIEVIPMARTFISRELALRGGRAVWRSGCTTDNGNHILDVHGLSITDPPALERELNQLPGVVTVGLFAVRPADVLLIGTAQGVEER
ncbi:MAG: ribose-5-phosphate isomerase RpiA [Gammaproteobacteria bacterium]|nr:ribose-5-phosphate isomerase RpiA [Gammaproteobacteria bacterium]